MDSNSPRSRNLGKMKQVPGTMRENLESLILQLEDNTLSITVCCHFISKQVCRSLASSHHDPPVTLCRKHLREGPQICIWVALPALVTRMKDSCHCLHFTEDTRVLFDVDLGSKVGTTRAPPHASLFSLSTSPGPFSHCSASSLISSPHIQQLWCRHLVVPCEHSLRPS